MMEESGKKSIRCIERRIFLLNHCYFAGRKEISIINF
jgi:hypothetical protein